MKKNITRTAVIATAIIITQVTMINSVSAKSNESDKVEITKKYDKKDLSESKQQAIEFIKALEYLIDEEKELYINVIKSYGEFVIDSLLTQAKNHNEKNRVKIELKENYYNLIVFIEGSELEGDDMSRYKDEATTVYESSNEEMETAPFASLSNILDEAVNKFESIKSEVTLYEKTNQSLNSLYESYKAQENIIRSLEVLTIEEREEFLISLESIYNSAYDGMIDKRNKYPAVSAVNINFNNMIIGLQTEGEMKAVTSQAIDKDEDNLSILKAEFILQIEDINKGILETVQESNLSDEENIEFSEIILSTYETACIDIENSMNLTDIKNVHLNYTNQIIAIENLITLYSNHHDLEEAMDSLTEKTIIEIGNLEFISESEIKEFTDEVLNFKAKYDKDMSEVMDSYSEHSLRFVMDEAQELTDTYKRELDFALAEAKHSNHENLKAYKLTVKEEIQMEYEKTTNSLMNLENLSGLQRDSLILDVDTLLQTSLKDLEEVNVKFEIQDLFTDTIDAFRSLLTAAESLNDLQISDEEVSSNIQENELLIKDNSIDNTDTEDNIKGDSIEKVEEKAKASSINTGVTQNQKLMGSILIIALVQIFVVIPKLSSKKNKK